jgi:YVTN family beta-propeller protein
MKYLLILLAFVMNLSIAFSQGPSNYQLDKKLPIAGNGGYDYLYLDAAARRIYISHGEVVNVINLDTEKPVGTVEGLSGVHGIAIAKEVNKGFVSNGKSNSVSVFDLTTLKVIKTIALTGKDPDAILYDPYSKRVFAFNGKSEDASVIDTDSLTQIGSVALGGGPEFAVADGEGKIFNNIEDKSVLKVIDAKEMKVIKSLPLSPCGGPTGLAYDKKNQRLFSVCRENKGMTVVDAQSGKVITTVPIGAGVDAVVFDPATKIIYCSNGDGTATVIKQETPDKYSVMQTLTTQWKAKTMALDPVTKKIYFSAYDMDAGNKNRIPDSFSLLIYKPKM